LADEVSKALGVAFESGLEQGGVDATTPREALTAAILRTAELTTSVLVVGHSLIDREHADQAILIAQTLVRDDPSSEPGRALLVRAADSAAYARWKAGDYEGSRLLLSRLTASEVIPELAELRQQGPLTFAIRQVADWLSAGSSDDVLVAYRVALKEVGEDPKAAQRLAASVAAIASSLPSDHPALPLSRRLAALPAIDKATDLVKTDWRAAMKALEGLDANEDMVRRVVDECLDGPVFLEVSVAIEAGNWKTALDLLSIFPEEHRDISWAARVGECEGLRAQELAKAGRWHEAIGILRNIARVGVLGAGGEFFPQYVERERASQVALSGLDDLIISRRMTHMRTFVKELVEGWGDQSYVIEDACEDIWSSLMDAADEDFRNRNYPRAVEFLLLADLVGKGGRAIGNHPHASVARLLDWIETFDPRSDAATVASLVGRLTRRNDTGYPDETMRFVVEALKFYAGANPSWVWRNEPDDKYRAFLTGLRGAASLYRIE
jgi:hypothetical protein